MMNELQIINLEQTDITTWNFQQLKAEVENVLSVYKTMVYTDDTIKMAKEDKAKLAKAKKIIEEQRKAYKAKCLEPYNAIEPQVKEIVGMIETQRIAIDDVVKDFTDRQKAEKEKTIRAYYDKKSFVLGDLADSLYEKILDPKWLNATASRTKVEEEIQTAINRAANDISTIKSMKSPFVETLMENYISTLSVEEVKVKHMELTEAADKAGISQKVNSAPIQEIPKEDVKINAEEGVILKIYATESQLNQVMDFMKAIGVDYEIQ